jgi:hypothetical protein
MTILPGNPYQTSAKLGSFKAYSDGVMQGLADADPAVQNWLNMGHLDPLATAPVWGGIPISEQVFAGNQSSNKSKLTLASVNTAITGFAVFDQGHHGVITPGPNNVPLFYPGMDFPYYRLGSRARIPVQCSSSLINLVGSGINPAGVTWNYATVELVATTAGATVPVTAVAVSGTANPYSGAFTTGTAAHGLSVGDTVTLAGFTPSGYNGTFVVESVPATNQFTVNLTTNPGAVTTQGTVATAAGTGTLAVTVLSIHTNSRIVFQDPLTGNITWKPGNCAIIQI